MNRYFESETSTFGPPYQQPIQNGNSPRPEKVRHEYILPNVMPGRAEGVPALELGSATGSQCSSSGLGSNPRVPGAGWTICLVPQIQF